MGEVPAFSLKQTTALPPTGPDLKRRAAGGTRRPLISNMMDTELLSPPRLRRRRLLLRRRPAPQPPTFSPVHLSAALRPCFTRTKTAVLTRGEAVLSANAAVEHSWQAGGGDKQGGFWLARTEAGSTQITSERKIGLYCSLICEVVPGGDVFP